MIHPKVPPLSPPLDEPRRACALCGPFYTLVEMRFDAGSVASTVDEVITGATSLDTGVVDEIVLESGSYAGGDAAGTISLSSPTGMDDNGLWGTDDEVLSGSSGATMVLNDTGFTKSVGRLWPENQLIFRDGKYYCRAHYHFRFDSKDKLETPFKIDDR